MFKMADESQMAPCPFCGQQGEYYINLVRDIPTKLVMTSQTEGKFVPQYYQYQVECSDCSATCYGHIFESDQLAYDSALRTWNCRRY